MMDLVLFEDALKHICRISRIISNPGGHALLVGVGGSGKQSLSKLAAHTCGMSPYMIVISGSYNTNALKEDLQKMFKRAGLKGEGIMWLFTDSQVSVLESPCGFVSFVSSRDACVSCGSLTGCILCLRHSPLTDHGREVHGVHQRPAGLRRGAGPVPRGGQG
jgi:hypothetical protein